MRGGIRVTDSRLVERPGPERTTVREWSLQLECGHTTTRPARYRPKPAGAPAYRKRRNLGAVDVLPAQKRAYCLTCPPAAPADQATRIRIRAAPARAAAVVELLRTVAPDLQVSGPRWRAGGFVDYYCQTNVTPAPAGEEGTP